MKVWSKKSNYEAGVRETSESISMSTMDYEKCYPSTKFRYNLLAPTKIEGYDDFEFIPTYELRCCELQQDDQILCYNPDTEELFYDKVVLVYQEMYKGYVYDVSLPDTWNFIANDIVVHNCIYSFKGADSSILVKNFDFDFRPTLSMLSYNYRCPSNILAPVVSSIHNNEDSKSQNILPFKEGGDFGVYSCGSMKQMIETLEKDVRTDLMNGLGVAIICRTNFDGMLPAFILESAQDIDFSISGEGMTLNSPLPRKILGAARLFTDRASTHVKTTLEYFVPRYSKYKIKYLIETMNMNRLNIWAVDEGDIAYSCSELLEFIQTCKHYMGSTRTPEGDIRALKYVYNLMRVDVFGSDTAYCMSARSYIDMLLYLINNRNFKSVQEFIDEVEYINERLVGRIKKNRANVRIVTVHEAKGKEYDSTYIWNDSLGVFPSSKTDYDDEIQMAEERRVHYIACTRARKRNTIYTLKGRTGLFVEELTTKIIDREITTRL